MIVTKTNMLNMQGAVSIPLPWVYQQFTMKVPASYIGTTMKQGLYKDSIWSLSNPEEIGVG
jgi:hypothetical protein